MAAIFSKSYDRRLRIGGVIFAVTILAAAGLFIYVSYPTVIDTGYSPSQPVPYSHKLPAGDLGIDCYYCHSTVQRAAFAAVPANVAIQSNSWWTRRVGRPDSAFGDAHRNDGRNAAWNVDPVRDVRIPRPGESYLGGW